MNVSRAEYDAALAEIERLRTALLPFAASCCTTRDGRGSRPETDTMTVEVEAGDWMRACVALGRMDVEYLRLLPAHARPTEAFLAALGPDEPSTEARPFDKRDYPSAFPATADALREQIAREVEAMATPLLKERVALSGVVLAAVAARVRSGPTTEPPKADEPPAEACVCMDGTADCVPPFGPSGGCAKSDDVPLSEPPKACPTCGDDLTDRDRDGHMWDEHGSGIDGGTPA